MLTVPAAPRRLLAAHVDPDGNPERRRLVEETWGGIERRLSPAWTLSCLIAAGGPKYAALDAAVAASRPGVALGHADRLLRLRTLYMSDDARDLVAIVGERYKEDIARFGYVFPANSSAPTMRT